MPLLIELTTDECERLLRRGTFGRMILATPRGIEVVPVNYTVHGSTLLVCTSSGGTLARFGDDAELVFEVDLVDEERWHGWSVVARGRGRVRRDDRPGPSARPWVAGDRTCQLRLTWEELTGRKVGAGWDPEEAMYSRNAVR